MWFQRGICAAFFIGLGSLAVIEGCSLVTGYDGFYGASATCGARVPAPPAKSANKTATGTFVGAAQTFRFANDAGAQPATLGLDLDEHCQFPACVPKSGNPRDLGVDNVLGKFISEKLRPQEDISIRAIKNGTLGLLVEVTNWNGAEDDEIDVSLFNVAGINGSADGGAQSVNDGSDVYIARDEDVKALPPVPKFAFTSNKAYVTKRQLVARFLLVRLRVITPTTPTTIAAIELPISDAVLVGTVSLVKGGIEMKDAQLVGRVLDRDMLSIISQLGLCPDSTDYSDRKSDLCGIVDLTDSTNTDGEKRPCTSASISIGLAIAPAKRDPATTAPAPLGPYLCPDNPSDTCGR